MALLWTVLLLLLAGPLLVTGLNATGNGELGLTGSRRSTLVHLDAPSHLTSMRSPTCAHYIFTLSGYQYEGLERTEMRCTRWCDARAKRGKGGATEDALEWCRTSCMERERAAHHKLLERNQPDPVDFSDMLFVVWYSKGDQGDGGFPTHHMEHPDMSFAAVLKKSHPGCSIIMTTDQATQLEVAEGVEVFRVEIDRSKMGRNAWADLFRAQAQIALLKHLRDTGARQNVVFVDMDALILDSYQDLFCTGFDYGYTVDLSHNEPINLGVQFARKDNYDAAIMLLEDLNEHYRMNFLERADFNLGCFTGGQMAVSDYLKIQFNDTMITEILTHATKYNYYCRKFHNKHNVCFFPATRYNMHPGCCGDLTPDLSKEEDIARWGVKSYHFVAWAKPGLPLVFRAFMEHGLLGAYRAMTHLPSSEEGYKDNSWFDKGWAGIASMAMQSAPSMP